MLNSIKNDKNDNNVKKKSQQYEIFICIYTRVFFFFFIREHLVLESHIIIFDSRFSEKKRVDNGVDREDEQEHVENQCD